MRLMDRDMMISVCMIKLCASSISKLMAILSKNCLKSESFPNKWKKTNIVPVHRKIKNSQSKIIEQYHCCQFVQNFLK